MSVSDGITGGDAAQRDVKILETAEDIQQRREQVLGRYEAFKVATAERRSRLEEARKYQLFRRNADELENWILEKLQTASDDTPFKDTTNLQVRIISGLPAQLQTRFQRQHHMRENRVSCRSTRRSRRR